MPWEDPVGGRPRYAGFPTPNDTVLLIAAISLLFVGWLEPAQPRVGCWPRYCLLLGYIAAGLFALKVTVSRPVRLVAAVLALAQVSVIFHLAMTKPVLF